jgi:nitrogen fixation-related uncharacterized protein
MKNLKKIALIIFISSIFFLPILSFAQGVNQTTVGAACANAQGIEGIICKITVLLNKVIPLLIGIGVIYFLWGVVTYVIGDEEEAKKKGKERVIYGIIGFVVIFSMWGLVGMVIKTLGISTTNSMITNPNTFVPTPTTNKDGTAFCVGGPLKANPLIGDVINYITCLIAKSVVPLIFTLAVVMFIWGVVQYVINDQEQAKKEKGRQFMIWGIIALTVMVSMWGLVSLLGGTFGIMGGIPQISTN